MKIHKNGATFEGTFYIPGENEKCTGSLTINSQRSVAFVMMGNIIKGTNRGQYLENPSTLYKTIPLIHFESRDSEMFTMYNSRIYPFLLHDQITLGYDGSSGETYCGNAFFDKKLLVSSVKFTFEGLCGWINNSLELYDSLRNYYGSLEDLPDPYKTEELFQIQLEENTNLKLINYVTVLRKDYTNEVTLDENPFIILESSRNNTFETYRELIHIITLFFCFLSARILSIGSIIFTTITSQGETTQSKDSFQFFGNEILISDTQIDVDWRHFEYTYQQLSENIEYILNSWLELARCHMQELDKYILLKSAPNTYYEGGFVDYARILETFHRKLYGEKDPKKDKLKTQHKKTIKKLTKEERIFLQKNAPFDPRFSFKNRIGDLLEDLLKHFSFSQGSRETMTKTEIDDIKDIISRQFRDTRNYETHGDGNSKKNVVKGIDEYFYLLRLAEMIFRFSIFHKLFKNQENLINRTVHQNEATLYLKNLLKYMLQNSTNNEERSKINQLLTHFF